MQISIQGHGIELTEPLREYAHKKIGRLEEFFKNIQRIQIILDVRAIDDLNQKHVAEVNLWAAGKRLIRASEAGKDMYAAIDEVFEELERQVKKHKEKRVHEVRREAEKFKHLTRTFVPTVTPSSGPRLAKLKRFNISVMTAEEARAERQKLGHDFFLFRNAETADINVIHGEETIDPAGVKTLAEEEAVKQLVGQNAGFLAFINLKTNELNVLYKRKSGNLGLIEPAL